MTDKTRPAGSGATPRRAGVNSLGFRLALGFLTVALTAVALLAGLTVVFASADVSSLASRQRNQLTSAVAAAAASGWELHHSWAGADLNPALDLALHAGAVTEIRDMRGTIVAASPAFAAYRTRPQFRAPIAAGGRPIGEVRVRFTGLGLGGADSTLRSALVRAIAAAAGLAALLALLTGLVMARRLSRPVARIISVTRAMGGGMRSARVGQVRAPDEISELGAALDQMADMLDRQEQLRRDMVADLAHELRTPLAILQAGHESLLDGVAEPTSYPGRDETRPGPDEALLAWVGEQLASLHEEVLRLARMVDDLQTLAAADAAALHLELRPCDLASVAEAAAGSLASRFEQAGISLQRSLTPVPILGDQRWLHQVVTNLLTNALKFSAAGTTVSVEVTQTGQDAVLRVTDQGSGITPSELPHIFDRFWRGREAARVSGSGIGLAVAAELAAAHGGELTAASEPGQGTQLTLRLPARAAPGRFGQRPALPR
jgi:two-component system, OmpR family, sensor histidine kinase BaeS